MALGLAEPGFATACYVEIEEYPRSTLIAGQRAGYLHPAPIWDDLKNFHAGPWRGRIDTILAGYPCQPFSQAGQRKGADDPRHLWPHIERIIGELQPRWCFFENVAGHITLGLEAVIRSLRGMGFTVAAGLFSAEETGAPHERQRVFIVAHRGHAERRESPAAGNQPDRNDPGRPQGHSGLGECGSVMAHRDTDADPRRLERGGTGPGSGGGEGKRGQREWVRSGPRSGGERDDGELAHRDGHGLERHPEPDGAAQKPGQQALGRRDAERRGVELAETSRKGSSQRKRQPGFSGFQVGASAREAANGSCPGIHPPGPGDLAAWRSVLDVSPDLAPAISFGDIKRAADHYAQMVAGGELAEAEAERTVRGLADAMAERPRILRLLGNGVCPLAGAYAWRSLSAALGLGLVDLGAAAQADRAEATQPDLMETLDAHPT